ncbi:histidine phosphatase family protein [Symbiobacterium thermophilum]|uniref:histidine phosphatase family protein n=1 Tax=Symbiobacterium thermophilum TaxID=2734 RepID=UPI003B5A9F51
MIRHCEASGQAADAPLTERGRAQAAELAERLAGLGIRRRGGWPSWKKPWRQGANPSPWSRTDAW